MKTMLVGLAGMLVLLASTAHATEIFVSRSTGSNGNDGTRESPLKNIEKALKKSEPGDAIRVAEGEYFGLRGKGYLESEHPVELYGGYAPDFSTRDVLAHPTLIRPTNESAAKSRKALLTFLKSKAGERIVVDGFIFDMGDRNSYHETDGKPEGVEAGMLLLPPSFNKTRGDKPTVTEQCIYIPAPASAGDVLVKNCAFLNGAKYAIQAGHKQGTFQVLNNIFVSNRMAALEIYGTGGKKGPKGPTEKDGHVEIAHNTILFTWSRLKDFQDMGYGIRVMTKLSYDIHHNIIGMNTLTGVDHTRFNKDDWLKIDDNIFFLNKQGDLMYSEPGQGQLERVWASEFEDLEFESCARNKDRPASALPVNKAYLEGFLAARYTEEADFDPDSPANVLREVMGLPKRGKLETTVSMFGNCYPLEDALKLFGATSDVGAQKPAE